MKHRWSKITIVVLYLEKAIILAKSLDIELLDENQLLNLEKFKKYISSQQLQLKHIPEW